jgi:hypothetical protein
MILGTEMSLNVKPADVVSHVCNPSCSEAAAGGWEVQVREGLHQKQNKNKRAGSRD